MLLTSILNKDLICCHLEGTTREELYRAMIARARAVIGMRESTDELLQRLMEAVQHGAMIEGAGFCSPHLRMEELNDFYPVLGIVNDPSGQPEESRVQVIVMGFIGGQTGETWLRTLSSLVRHLVGKGMLAEMAQCTTPRDVMAHLDRYQVMLKRHVTADDLMSPPAFVELNASISDALDRFATEKCSTLAVVDENGKLVGELNALDIISKFIPEYYFMMQSINFLTDSDPFEQLARSEKSKKVREFMIPPRKVINADMPLIRFTIELCRRTAYSIFVTDEDGRLIGELTVKDLIHRVLRG